METVGKILKTRRENKQVTLRDASEELKIPQDTLINFENDFFQKDIDSVYILGHLRSYSSFLDLNYNELNELFRKQHLPEKKVNIEIEKPGFEFKLFFSNKLISLSLIVAIFGTFYLLFIEVENNNKKEYAIIPDLPENFSAIVEKANLDDLNLNKQNQNELEQNFAETDNVSNSSSAIASVSKNEDQKSQIITLKILDDTWIQLRDKNDEIIFSQLMNKNDEYSYDMLNNYSITSGNAGNILVLIDQKVKGKIGKKGQVVDSLVINKDYKN